MDLTGLSEARPSGLTNLRVRLSNSATVCVQPGGTSAGRACASDDALNAIEQKMMTLHSRISINPNRNHSIRPSPAGPRSLPASKERARGTPLIAVSDTKRGHRAVHL
jgi:hypothetical protein